MKLVDYLDFNEVKNEPIEELKSNELPLLIYGGGSFARDILHYLESNGIIVEGVFVDEGGFVLPDIISRYKVKQIAIKSIDFPCYVVMGMANYLKGQTLINENIKKIFYLSVNPYGDSGAFLKKDIAVNIEKYQSIYSLLEDDLSRKCMAAFLNSRIKNDASCVFPCYEREQTYFDNTVFRVVENENYIDIGAYTGDTIELFYEACNKKPGRIWAFEGEAVLEAAIRETISKLGIESITELYITGLWSSKKEVFFSKADYNIEEGMVTTNDTGVSIDADTVDHILDDRMEKVDIIKINFDSADEVLKGCKKIICKDHPKIAAVVSFKNLVCDIPRIVREMDASYKIFLRFNSAIPARLVMYAI